MFEDPQTLYLHFFFESSESYRLFNYLHDSYSIIRAGRINSERFFGRTVIEQFENHPSWNMLLEDFEKSEEINHFSQES